jgi:hypothetical protein
MRYMPLDQITRDNFDKLEIAWRLETDSLGPRPEFNFQTTAPMTFRISRQMAARTSPPVKRHEIRRRPVWHGQPSSVCHINVATTVASTPLRVLIVGRSRDDVEEVASVAQGRAGATGQPHVFDTITAKWADGSIAGDILHTHRPTVTVVTASEQSPWELADEANAWAQLVKRGGFGLTLPFNASLASEVFRAATATEPRPFFINACYPDAVNSLLAALGPSDRLIGVGNAAIIESLYRAASGHHKAVRVVAAPPTPCGVIGRRRSGSPAGGRRW